MRELAGWKWVVAGMVVAVAGCAGEQAVATRPAAPVEKVVAVSPRAPAGFVDVRAVVIVRHADIDVAKKLTLGNAVPLTERGEERARELAYALKDFGVTRIVTSEALRTKETAAVLAKELGLPEEVASGHGVEKAGMPQASEASLVIGYLSETGKPGDVVLLVHHHSVLPSLLAKFGYEREPAYDDATEFDRMYVVLPDRAMGTYRVLRVRYGAGGGH